MKIRLFYLISVFGLLLFLIQVFSYSVSYNVNVTNANFYVVKDLLLPQGWGFFTKDIREEFVYNLYNVNGEKVMVNNSSYENFFGFSKKARKISMEVAIIESRISNNNWLDSLSVVSNPAFLEVSNEYLYYLKGGRYVLTRHMIPPYLWRDLPKNKKTEVVFFETKK